jgi:hypothetical protein
MYSYLLQDWITLQGASAITVLGPGENDWLDLSGFQDIVAWLEVKEVSPTSGVLAVAYQTSPTKDDALFFNMTTAISVTGPGLTTTVMLKDTALVPLARWLRWQVQLSSAASWNVTFRILCAVNAIGSNRPATQSGGAAMGQ